METIQRIKQYTEELLIKEMHKISSKTNITINEKINYPGLNISKSISPVKQIKEILGSSNHKKVILENRRKLFDFYTNNACVDCGESNPIVLELDHRKGSEKHSEVSNMVGGGLSWATIEKEIEKCEVRCANCHRIKTAEQQGWYKDFL